ncbi:12970_t:CDS:2, partial [Gigaspora margarita]
SNVPIIYNPIFEETIIKGCQKLQAIIVKQSVQHMVEEPMILKEQVAKKKKKTRRVKIYGHKQ